ncbi:Pr6Pr family membrane protein [Devosia sp.]|uniref:Pr6Pr family membrane protein n=1 Tax=Devosia sp. TaxID=1871048 RepID=UPI003BAA8439
MNSFVVLIGLILGVAGLAIDAASIFPAVMTVSAENLQARSLLDAFVYFWSFFTHLTNLLLLLVYISELTNWRALAWFRSAQAQAMAASYIMLVGLYFHFMLSPYLHLEGALGIATWILHYLTPALYMLWWLGLARHGALAFRAIPMLLAPGLVYVVLILIRGAFTGEYPYEILDVGKNGYGGVAIGVGVLVLAVAIFSVIIVAADKLLARRSRPA